jgi:hypothetical protein
MTTRGAHPSGTEARGPAPVRVALAAIALLAVVWVAILLRDLYLGEDAANRIVRSPSAAPAALDRQLDRLSSAQLLNPDPVWTAQRAAFLLLRGQPRRAVNETEALVRREPDNIGAWSVLLDASTRIHSPRAAEARARIMRLDPLGGRDRIAAHLR